MPNGDRTSFGRHRARDRLVAAMLHCLTIIKQTGMRIIAEISNGDFGHYRSSEKHADNSLQLGKYGFLSVL